MFDVNIQLSVKWYLQHLMTEAYGDFTLTMGANTSKTKVAVLLRRAPIVMSDMLAVKSVC